ncbi:hypothetical protein [Glutamicibacter protophormiae]|uniref:hypothetical protein n=1 Tax=Glutamicibacter protophormiae TaxID=37930 RepID=UPI003A906F02
MTTNQTDPSDQPQRRYFTTEEVADVLRLEKRSVANWRYRATPYGPPYVLISGVVRYPADAFLTWCDEQDSTASNSSNNHRNREE